MKKNKRSLIIAIILVIGVSLTIGYAVLSQTLKINGRANIAANSWIIYFDHLVERPGSIEATSPAVINAAKDQIDFGITLDKPGDNYTFEVDIINDGTIDAMIDSVSMSGIPSALNGIVEWKVNYLTGEELQKCDELLANSKRRIKVVVNYNKDIEELPDEQDLNLTFTVKYVQLDNSVCTTTNPPSAPDPIDPNDGRHTLTIDPNYGKYNGTDDVTKIRMAKGEVYVIGTATHEVYTFAGWIPDKEDVYDESTSIITMDEEDITMLADWTWDEDENHEYTGTCFKVGEAEFTDFKTAIDYIAEEGTIKLVSNQCRIGNGDGNWIRIPKEKNITFNLNGHAINSYNTIDLYEGGTFNIIDTSDRKTGTITVNRAVSQMIYNYQGEANINGGNYTLYGELLNNSSGKVSVANATIYLSNESTNRDLYAIHNFGEAEISNCQITADTYKGGDYIIYSSNQLNYVRDVSIILNGHGSSLGSTYGIKNQGKTEIENFDLIVNGDFYSFFGIYSDGSTEKSLTINNANIKIEDNYNNSQLYGVFATSQKVIAENLNIDIKGNNGSVYGFSPGGFTYNGGTINIEINNANTIYGIENRTSGGANELNDVDITIKVNTNGGGTAASVGNANIDNVNVNIETAYPGNGTSYGIYGSSIKIKNSTIKNTIKCSQTPGGQVYSYGISGSSIEAENIEIETNSDYFTYGIYGTTKIKDSTINVNSKEYAYGIYDPVEIINTTINVNSTRNSGMVGQSTSVAVCGVYKRNDYTIEDSTITVTGESSAEGANNEGVNEVCQ